MRFGYDISKIERRMLELGQCPADVARIARVHPSTVANVLRGRTRRPATVQKLAKAVGLSLDQLVIEEAVA